MKGTQPSEHATTSTQFKNSYKNNPLQMNKVEIQRGHKEASKYTFDCDVLLKV